MAYLSLSGSSCSQTDPKRHALHSFGTDQRGRERNSDEWATQNFFNFKPRRTLERTLQSHLAEDNNTEADSYGL